MILAPVLHFMAGRSAEPPANRFSIALSETVFSEPQSGQATFDITLTQVAGTAESANLSVVGLPTGVGAGFSLNSISTDGGTSTVTLSFGESAPAVTADSFQVRAIATSQTKSRGATVTVEANDFSVAVTNDGDSIAQGGNAAFTVTLTKTSGNGQTTSAIVVSGLPSGVTAAVADETISTDGGTTTVTLTASGSATLGAATFTVTVTAPDAERADTGNVTITEGAGYTPFSELPAPSGPVKRSVDGDTLALFHFDEGSGTSATDATTTYTGTLVGGTTWGTDLTTGTGTSLTFDGTNDAFEIDGLLDTIPAEGMIELWVRPGKAYPSIGEYPRLFHKGTTGPTGNERIDAYIDPTSGKLTILLHHIDGVDEVNTFLYSTRTTWDSGTDYHIAFVWGANGIRLYVDGVLNDWEQFYDMPIDGDYAPFNLGAIYFEGAYQGFFMGSIDELRVMDAAPLPELIHASHELLTYSVGIEESGRWVDRETVLSPTGDGTFEADLVIEPSVVYDGTEYHLFYTGYRLDTFTGQIAHATSPDGHTWTRQGKILGGGTGGESGSWVSCVEVKYVAAGQWVAFYAVSFGNLCRATSTDGYTWTKTGVVISATAQGWMNGISNCGVLIDGSTWRMLYESGDAGVGEYYLGYATSTDLGETWTLYGSNPLTTLAWKTGGIYSGPSIHLVDGVYHLWYHGGVEPLNAAHPNSIAHATSADFITWTPVYNPPVFDLAGETFPGGAADQVADPAMIQIGSDYWLFYDVDRNTDVSGVEGRIDRSRWNGA